MHCRRPDEVNLTSMFALTFWANEEDEHDKDGAFEGSCPMFVASSPGPSQLFNVHKKSGRVWYVKASEWCFTWNRPGINLIVCGSEFCFLAYIPYVILSLIRVFQLLEIRFNDKARSINSYQRFISNALDLMVGMVTCRRVSGSPTFLMNVKILGVAWGTRLLCLSV